MRIVGLGEQNQKEVQSDKSKKVKKRTLRDVVKSRINLDKTKPFIREELYE